MLVRVAVVVLILFFLFIGNLWAGTQANPCAVPNVRLVFWIPQFGHGIAQGSLFSTLTRIINLQESVIKATIVTCSDAGQPLAMLRRDGPGGPTAVSQLEIDIPGRGTTNIPSFSAGNQLRVGYGLVNSISAMGVEVLFDIRRDDGFVTSTNVRAGVLRGFPEPDFESDPVKWRPGGASLYADLSPGVNTGLAILSPRDSNDPVRDVLVKLLFLDSNGELQATGQQLLKEGQKVSKFANEFLAATQGIEPSGLQPFSGSIEIQTSGEPCYPNASDPVIGPNLNSMPCPISVIPLRQEGLVLTTQRLLPTRFALQSAPQGQLGPAALQFLSDAPPQSLGGVQNPCRGTTLAPDLTRWYWIPHYGHGTIPSSQPAQRLEFDTVIKFLNLDYERVGEETYEAHEAEFEIVSCSDQGQPMKLMAAPGGPQGPVPVSFMKLKIPPNGVLELKSLNEKPNSEIGVGYSIARSTDFVVPEVIFNIRRGDGFLTSTNVPIYPIVTAVAFIADIDEAALANTGIAFMFPWDFDFFVPEPGAGVQRSMIDLFLMDQDGVLVAQHTFTLDRGHKTALFLNQIFGSAQGVERPFTGSLDIRASHPVSVLPLRQEGLVLTTQDLFPPRVIREVPR